mmetsp:Transcript_25957/g.53531  ORF Transcript_25957/g.53531 Transcript_25957/m.53531 type:complete len:86 (-) Transcript_25957:2046-2303(-)
MMAQLKVAFMFLLNCHVSASRPHKLERARGAQSKGAMGTSKRHSMISHRDIFATPYNKSSDSKLNSISSFKLRLLCVSSACGSSS